MSMNVTVSSTARRRIRAFSVWVWVLGGLVLGVGALNTYADVGVGDGGFALLDAGANPWDIDEPPVFEAVGSTYSGEGSGLIRIPLEEHSQEPYLVHFVSDGYVDIFVTRAEDLGRPADDRGYPDSVAYLYSPGDEALVLPAEADLELWVRSDDPWEFTLQKADVAEITDGFASGTDNNILVYRGDAVSARFVHKGDGVFFVTIQTTGGDSDQPIIESGDVDQRQSWDPTDAVYFTIEADDGRGAWSIDIDELATEAPAEPDPDTASPEPAALTTRGNTLR
ncbi:hypothetical protein BJQ94_17840 [Cryobacterium sp. SO2]|uniref:hypothetical protein n=1 Tax=Cryobacterium sp. SO2 TaxID=1897060 RepID=UPI00223D565F|nr:hypothetical protein [Cryobacterium sp. SO2]WEO77191.1 hypothetical protein BJQ94_17840 [Cryobacterium sp. SO2]